MIQKKCNDDAKKCKNEAKMKNLSIACNERQRYFL